MTLLRKKGGRPYRVYRLSWFFRGLLFIGGLVIILLFLLYTQSLLGKLRENATSVSNAYAKLLAVATYPTTAGPELNVIFEEVIRKTDFPIILTDTDGVPRVWKQVPVAWDDNSPQAVARLIKLVRRMDRINDPIPLQAETEGEVIGHLHYGESSLVKRLSWLPYVGVAVVICFVLIGVYGFQNIKKSEQRYIWVGMAKETAHQFGTPLSSLMGWLELMKDQIESNRSQLGGEDHEKFDSMVVEMNSEVDRLSTIASRFGQIGSVPELNKTDILPMLSESVSYLRRRLPRVSREIRIEEIYRPLPPVAVNTDLLAWVVENLVKNAIDAMTGSQGVIEVRTEVDKSGKCVNIAVKDEGRGIGPNEQRKIFLPGYTTKKRGWGLGLTLAKRIVEEYHQGRLYLADSKPRKGSTFIISLPVA
jgi:anti-sigma regulatory factor (Ser/Thr protein kinase)